MYLINSKRNPIYAFLFRILGLLVGISAITLQLFTNKFIGKGFMANHVLAYFTLQTNIFTTLVFLSLVIKTIIIYFKRGKLINTSINRSLHLATTFYITITMLVYWTALAPVLGVGSAPLSIANTLFLHLFTPLMSIIDALLFMKHGKIKRIDSVKWLAYPISYLISLIIIANVSDVPYYQFKIGDEVIPLHYPYPFLEPQIVGVWGLVLVSFLLLLFSLGFAYLYISIDKKICDSLIKRRDSKKNL